jgi:hypothetical protein
MVVTPLWIRDHYDANKSCRIEDNELAVAEVDFYHNSTISEEELEAVMYAHETQMLLPAYDEPSQAKGEIVNLSYQSTAIQDTSISIDCRVYNSGESSGTFKVALYRVTLFSVRDYDKNNDCYIDANELKQAVLDRTVGKITAEEESTVIVTHDEHINVCDHGIMEVETLVAQTPTWLQSAKTTTGIKTLTTTVPSTETSATYMLKCIRMV